MAHQQKPLSLEAPCTTRTVGRVRVGCAAGAVCRDEPHYPREGYGDEYVSLTLQEVGIRDLQYIGDESDDFTYK